MNIHEYQARELFENMGWRLRAGKVATTPDEAEEIARALRAKEIVVKAQIHAGGRGKGTFKNGFKGGVYVCPGAEEVRRGGGEDAGAGAGDASDRAGGHGW